MAVIRESQGGAGEAQGESQAPRARKWQAIVRKGGYSLSRVFWQKREAETWARRVEDAIVSATPAAPFDRAAWLRRPTSALAPAVDDSRPHPGWTLARAFGHYGDTVTPAKKGGDQELRRVAMWEAHPLGAKRLDALTTADLQDYADTRLAAGRAASTVRLDIMVVRALYRDAGRAWGLAGLRNPAVDLRLPAPAPGRQRRLEDAHEDHGEGEEARLRAALAAAPSGPEMLDLMDVALETGMRQGEILALTKGQLRRVRGARFVEQPDSKNGHPRRVVLSTRAVAILDRRAQGKGPEARLFTMMGADLRQRWNAARKKAKVDGFRWHDLRHEALSRMAGMGLTIGELQAQSGHRTAGVLLRYVNARPQDVAEKLVRAGLVG